MMIHCRRASRLISESMDRRLSPFERAALGVHLCICDMCARYRKQLSCLRDAMARWWNRPETGLDDKNASLTDAAKERIRRRLNSD